MPGHPRPWSRTAKQQVPGHVHDPQCYELGVGEMDLWGGFRLPSSCCSQSTLPGHLCPALQLPQTGTGFWGSTAQPLCGLSLASAHLKTITLLGPFYPNLPFTLPLHFCPHPLPGIKPPATCGLRDSLAINQHPQSFCCAITGKLHPYCQCKCPPPTTIPPVPVTGQRPFSPRLGSRLSGEGGKVNILRHPEAAHLKGDARTWPRQARTSTA